MKSITELSSGISRRDILHQIFLFHMLISGLIANQVSKDLGGSDSLPRHKAKRKLGLVMKVPTKYSVIK